MVTPGGSAAGPPLRRESLGGIHVPLYSLAFDVRPRSDSTEYGRIRDRGVAVWIPSTSQSAAAAEAREVVRRYGYEIVCEGEVREWDVTSNAVRSMAEFRAMLPSIQRDGFAFEYRWADEA